MGGKSSLRMIRHKSSDVEKNMLTPKNEDEKTSYIARSLEEDDFHDFSNDVLVSNDFMPSEQPSIEVLHKNPSVVPTLMPSNVPTVSKSTPTPSLRGEHDHTGGISNNPSSQPITESFTPSTTSSLSSPSPSSSNIPTTADTEHSTTFTTQPAADSFPSISNSPQFEASFSPTVSKKITLTPASSDTPSGIDGGNLINPSNHPSLNSEYLFPSYVPSTTLNKPATAEISNVPTLQQSPSQPSHSYSGDSISVSPSITSMPTYAENGTLSPTVSYIGGSSISPFEQNHAAPSSNSISNTPSLTSSENSIDFTTQPVTNSSPHGSDSTKPTGVSQITDVPTVSENNTMLPTMNESHNHHDGNMVPSFQPSSASSTPSQSNSSISPSNPTTTWDSSTIPTGNPTGINSQPVVISFAPSESVLTIPTIALSPTSAPNDVEDSTPIPTPTGSHSHHSGATESMKPSQSTLNYSSDSPSSMASNKPTSSPTNSKSTSSYPNSFPSSRVSNKPTSTPTEKMPNENNSHHPSMITNVSQSIIPSVAPSVFSNITLNAIPSPIPSNSPLVNITPSVSTIIRFEDVTDPISNQNIAELERITEVYLNSRYMHEISQDSNNDNLLLIDKVEATKIFVGDTYLDVIFNITGFTSSDVDDGFNEHVFSAFGKDFDDYLIILNAAKIFEGEEESSQDTKVNGASNQREEIKVGKNHHESSDASNLDFENFVIILFVFIVVAVVITIAVYKTTTSS